jgi:XTP/dITP diphosphohydrolase
MHYKTFILATTNKHKLKEFKEIINSKNIKIISSKKLFRVKENKKTFKENALKKAKTYYKKLLSPIIAEDSGICVDALKGKPGIYSARFAGENASDKENLLKLLSDLQNKKNRKACYKCSIVLYYKNNKYKIFQGACYGKIALNANGTQGFGYDPIFIPNGYKKTFGFIGKKTKNKISHRAHAIEKLVKFIKLNW